ncbi:hypothetical protein CRE_22027 [Caenorhabditis remanei]|uniref:Sdz-33 F-box domain-containing protein n=1 Tax=Caenorhabditis remanei TaxID=31234 RepID=E3N3G3_CAERE|nr:hypothetical protein CRE_22027 [Caenorhabditis remanei]
MPPFPLLRLPRLGPGSRVFKSLSIGEKIKLSFCSKRISTQINNARLYCQKVMVHVRKLYRYIEVHTGSKKSAFDIFNYSHSGIIDNPNMQQYQIEGHTVPVISFAKEISIFWENHQEGFLSVIRYLLNIFQCKIAISNNCNSDLYQPTVSELFDLQVAFKKLTIYFEGSNDENLFWKHISNKFGQVEDLQIISVANPGFRPVFTSWPLRIYIASSVWFTLKSLLECTCTKITLQESRLENKDLDMILKNWKTGGFPNLQYLSIRSKRIKNNATTILGMRLLELDEKAIQTDDGSKKAIMNTANGRIEMSVTLFE